MTTFLLVRHGFSQANQAHLFAGQTDVPLLDTGLAQAKCTADYLVSHYRIDDIYASDLQRAFYTGKYAADLLGKKVIPDSRLREIYAGEWEGVAFDTLVQRYPESYRIWREDIGHAHCDGGESVAQLLERIKTALKDIAGKNPGKTVLIATHATPIRVMQSFVSYGSLDRMKEIPWVSNASFSVLNYEHDNWNFGLISQDTHLSDLKTDLPKNV